MSDIPHFFHMMLKAPRYDVIILVTTFLLTVFINLVVAVNVGVILAMLFFIGRMKETVSIKQHNSEKLQKEFGHHHLPPLPHDWLVYSIQGPFFFGAAEKIERALVATHTAPKIIILRLKEVPFMDMTGLDTLQELIEQYEKKHIKVYLCEANSRIVNKLKELGILNQVCENRVFPSLSAILKKLHHDHIPLFNLKDKPEVIQQCIPD